MIRHQKGRWKSERTSEETEDLLTTEIRHLTPDQQVALEALLAEDSRGEEQLAKYGREVIYHTIPVSMADWLDDPYHMNASTKTLYPKIREDLIDVFETPSIREVVLVGSIGFGKCIDASCAVEASTGLRTVADIAADGKPVRLLSMQDDGTVSWEDARVEQSGEKRVETLVLLSGRQLKMSADHPVRTAEGWKRLSQLVPGDHVAMAWSTPEPENPVEVDTWELLNGAEAVARDPTDSRVPPKFFSLPRRQLALFINCLWSHGGVVRCGDSSPTRHLKFRSHSRGLIEDIQNLLLRFGVHARVRVPRASAFDLMVTGSVEIARFFEAIGALKGKESACAKLLLAVRNTCGTAGVDVSPLDYDTWASWKRNNYPKTRKYTRKLFGKCSRMGGVTFRQLVKDESGVVPDKHKWWANVFWDRVKEVTKGSHRRLPVYDIEVPATKSFLLNGIAVHNTTFASVAMCRLLYELSCMRSPQLAFGLSPGSEMVISPISKSLHLARTVLKSAIDDKLKISPYFREEFTPKYGGDITKFPSNLMLSIGSFQSARTLGQNIFGGCLDEANFGATKGQQIMATGTGAKTIAQYDIAEKIYAGIVRRIKSRFLRAGGNLPGLMVLISSANTVGSFTDRKIAQSINDPTVFARDYSAWDVKPPEHYSGKKFQIVVGTSALRSRIVAEDDEIDAEWLDREGAIVLDVPIEYYDDFDRDLEGSIRDIAGLSTHAISAYINRLEKLEDRVTEDLQHPFTTEVYQYGQSSKFKWDLLSTRGMRRLPGGFEEPVWKPIRNPNALRYIHIDTSISGDCTGLCMGYVDRMVEVIRRDEDMNEYNDIAPYIVIEFMLRIAPPPGEQIYLADVRRLVYELMAHGFDLCGFSCDSYQSADTIQQIKRHGVKAEIVSVDRTTAPYDSLKSAIYEDRIDYYRYKPFMDEMKALEWDRLKGKVDHPLSGCFVGDTMIALPDGSDVSIASLADKEVEVFACNKLGTIVCARARGRETKHAHHLYEIRFTDGTCVRCTPEHWWMLASGNYLEASMIAPMATLLKPFNREWTSDGYIPMSVRCQVDSVSRVQLTQPVPVYDLEVYEHSNFALTAGAFVHNSKDVSDAVAGAVYGLTEAVKRLPIAMPLTEAKPKPLEEMAWMGGDVLIPVGPDFDSERFREEYGLDDDGTLPPGLIPIVG